MRLPAIIVILSAILLSFAFRNADSMLGEYILKGKVYFHEKPVRNDSLKMVFRYNKKKFSTDDVRTLYTDSDGNYFLRVEFFIPCPSSHLSDCGSLSRLDCFHKCSNVYNPDSLGFVYAKKQVCVYNQYWEIYRQRENGKIIERDIRF